MSKKTRERRAKNKAKRGLREPQQSQEFPKANFTDLDFPNVTQEKPLPLFVTEENASDQDFLDAAYMSITTAIDMWTNRPQDSTDRMFAVVVHMKFQPLPELEAFKVAERLMEDCQARLILVDVEDLNRLGEPDMAYESRSVVHSNKWPFAYVGVWDRTIHFLEPDVDADH